MHYQRARYHNQIPESPPERACDQCGESFQPRRWPQRYCSEKCQQRAKYIRSVGHGRRQETCEQCGTSLKNRRADARFCSDKCGSDFHNAEQAAALRARPPKRCLHCDAELPLGRWKYCDKVCQAGHRRARTYHLNTEELAALLAQHDVCASCGSPDWGSSKGPQVDHDHVTGRIRGVLCIGCNTAAGSLDDSPEKARKLADYLERPLD